jgi:hypothetical protein
MFIDDYKRAGIEADFITRAMNANNYDFRGQKYKQYTGAPSPPRGLNIEQFIQDVSESQKNLSDRIDALESDLKKSKEMEGMKGFWKNNSGRIKNAALVAVGLYFAYSIFMKNKMAMGGRTQMVNGGNTQINASDI